MAKRKKLPEWYLEQMKRSQEMRELLERRKARDEEIRAQRQRRAEHS